VDPVQRHTALKWLSHTGICFARWCPGIVVVVVFIDFLSQDTFASSAIASESPLVMEEEEEEAL